MPSPKPRAADASPSATESHDPQHDLLRVRDILFGDHQRDTDRRLAELEQRTTEQFAALRRELAAAVGGESTSLQRNFEQAIASNQAAWQRAHDALQQDLAQKLQELAESKLDRDALAGLLGGLANRLGNNQAAAGG